MSNHLTTFSTNTFYSNSNKRNKLNGGNSSYNSSTINNVSLSNSLARDRDEKRFFTHSPARKRAYPDKHSSFYPPNSYGGNSRKSSPYNRTSPRKRFDLSRAISGASNFNPKKRKLNFTGENKINTKDDSKLQMKKSRSSSEEAYRKHNSSDSSPNNSLNRLFKSDQSNGQSTSRNSFATSSNNDSVNQLFDDSNLINDKVHSRKPVLIDEVRNEDKENSINKLDYQDNRSRLNRSNENLDTFSKQSDISYTNYPAYQPRYNQRMTDDDKFYSTQKSSNSCYGNHSSIVNNGQFPVALKNLGNTCYMNACLQPLFNLQYLMGKLRDSLDRSLKADPSLEETFPMTIGLLELHKEYKRQGARQPNNIDDLARFLAQFKNVVSQVSPEFASSGQHDAVEFLDSVINGIDDEFELARKSLKPKISNPIDELFKLELAEETVCESCKLKSNIVKTKSHCLILSLPEEQTMEDNPNLGLQHILKNYFKPEKRESECEKCGNKERNRYLNVIKPPKALILLLGRYSATSEKRHEQIKVPFGITLPRFHPKSTTTPKIDPDQPSTSSSSPSRKSNPDDSQFQLSGVICHHGTCLTGGHYICYVHDKINDQWYQCDDENIVQTSFERVQEGSKNSGYGFFYLDKKYF